jgi:hypothetical protein
MDKVLLLLCQPFVKRMWVIYNQIVHVVVNEMLEQQFLDGKQQGIN